MSEAAAGRDRLSSWCGWVLVGAAVLAPLLAWLGPLGFAPLLTLMGLLSLPAFRVPRADRFTYGLLLGGLIWVLAANLWSPFQPKDAGSSTALKLALELPIYWAAICGARRADPRLARRALTILVWGMAAFGLVLVAEAVTEAELYRRIHVAFYEPIRPDLAGKNIGQATFVLALLWPLLAVGAKRAGVTPWIAAPMVAGVIAAAHAFGFDAPMLSVILAPAVGWAAWMWPSLYPRLLAAKIAVFFLLAPVFVTVGIGQAGLAKLQAVLPSSWADRVGYWSYAADRIGEKPAAGWGLDASRVFGCCIQLHPHNSALQVWLELGAVGAVLAALFWAAALARLSRPGRDLQVAALAASTAAYLLFGALNFGIWQEWWLALGAFAVVLAALADRSRGATQSAVVQPST